VEGRSANRDCLLGIFGRLTATCRRADGTASLFASGGGLGLQDGRRALVADPVHETYTASNENNLINAYYERPAMLALAGNVAAGEFLTLAAALAP
jgi:hypothetical protein